MPVGYCALRVLLPEHKLGVVVLANSASTRPVVDRVAVEALELALEVKSGIVPPEPAKPAKSADTPSEDTRRAFEGRYTTLVGAVKIEQHGRGLRAEVAGRELLIASDGYTRLLAGERLTPRAIPEAWRQRVGKYELVNRGQDEALFESPSLVIQDGLLLLRVKMLLGGEWGEMLVEPLSDTDAVVTGPLAGAGETIRVIPADGGEMWRYSGYLFRRKAD